MPKSSCDYEAPGVSDGSPLFALSWFTSASWIAHNYSPLQGMAVTEIAPPPAGAIRAYREGLGTQVLYQGIWIQWSKQSDPTLEQEIERSVDACLTSGC